MLCHKKHCEDAAVLGGILCADHRDEFVAYYAVILNKDERNEIARLQIKIHGLEKQLKDERHKVVMLTNKCKRYRQGRER